MCMRTQPRFSADSNPDHVSAIWEDCDAIDGWTISESFVSTIVGGRPVKIRLEDKIAQKWNFSRTGSIEADFKWKKQGKKYNNVPQLYIMNPIH